MAARDALQVLAVDRAHPHASMSSPKRALRNRLRARGRQLGDRHDAKFRTQEIAKLGHDIAYEHWHRMLFARFLAENGLLLEPNQRVAVSLEECGELARTEGTDRWAMAGRFAAQMLPDIFRQGDPVLDIVFAPEARQELDSLLESLPRSVFLATDSLGWTYQFWQASRKDEVNKSGNKIGADELPAVTQLFTEQYMVRFLLHNTIGAWWAEKILADAVKRDHRTEDELRRAVRIDVGGSYDFSYLRFVRDDDHGWEPAAGRFATWPKAVAELRLLDPCCGSGHFLAEALELLAHLRMKEENLSVQDAVCLVLKDNIHGLEIDPRCTQIAAFNVAFTAWRLLGRPFSLPRINIACSGLAPNCTLSEWVAVVERAEPRSSKANTADMAEPPATPLQTAMADMHKLFSRAPELGSMIDPDAMLGPDLLRADFDMVRQGLAEVLERERKHAGDNYERTVAAAGMARAAKLLTGTYVLVATNVPYLLRRKQSCVLQEYIGNMFSNAKNDLATAFVERSFKWLGNNGTQAIVSPQAWLSLTGYHAFRKTLLQHRTWNQIVRLGTGAFRSISGHVVNVILGILSSEPPCNESRMSGIDLSQPTADGKDREVLTRRFRRFVQCDQINNIESRIILGSIRDLPLLALVADYGKGSMTGDRPRFLFRFWEARCFRTEYTKWLNSAISLGHWAGRSEVCKVPIDSPLILEQRGSGINGARIFGRFGVAINKMNLRPCLYAGEVFDDNVGPICSRQSSIDLTAALWAYACAPEYAHAVREIDQQLKITAATLVKVPFDLERWKEVAKEQYPHGLPEPYSDNPTQWLFHGHPCGSVVWDKDAKRLAHGPLRTNATSLQVAVARLLGYRWPTEHEAKSKTPDRSQTRFTLSEESEAWAERAGALGAFADEDGIACIPPVGGERSAQDRLREILAAAYGTRWSDATERALLASTNENGKPPVSINDWLRNGFFQQHCKLFHNRPFIWHVWDGRRDGFHALVNYHRLAGPEGDGRRTLKSLTYHYLGAWIEQQRDEKRDNRPGADDRLAAAIDLQAQLERIATGEPPLDIFVRWRPLQGQPLGWEPQIDDGVRLNIRPFMRAELRFGGRKGAGILRWKPNIKWGKDRGKEPEHHKETGEEIRPPDDFPWFWGCPGNGSEADRTDFVAGPDFDGNRWNDLHYTRAAKETARAEAIHKEQEAQADKTKPSKKAPASQPTLDVTP